MIEISTGTPGRLGKQHAIRFWPASASRAVYAAALSLFLVAAAYAQSTNSADLRGTVSDSTGAVIPGVKVTILNVETGVTMELTTNDAGIYDSVSIRPGKYRITFSKEGFGKLVRDGITLDVGVLSIDAQLAVGETQQQVEVVAEAPLLKTDTGEQSSTLRTDLMQQLPNIGQDWQGFEKVLPGFQGANNANGAYSINGTMPNYSNIMADGGSVILPHSDNFDVAIFETLSEVQIQTSTFSAQYGIGGAVFNQISKGGTNQIHGAAYEYLRNNFFNSRNTFSPSVSLSRWHNFGGSVGGPVIKNKMFYYFNADKIINKGGSYPFSSFPTALARAGNFSDTGSNKLTSYQNLIYDPQTTVSTGPSQFTRSPFPGNTIPQTRFSPVAIAAEALWPMPNIGAPNQVANNYQTFVPSTSPFIKYFGRLDYNASDANRITFSITQRDNKGVGYSSNCPSGCNPFDIDSWNIQVSDAWTISPTMVNEFRMAYTRQGNWYVPMSYGQGYPQKLGITYAVADVLPTISVGGPVGNPPNINPGTNAIYAEDSLQPSDVVTLIRGKHILHFGGELLDFRDNSTPWGNINAATMNFSGAFTRSAYNVTTSGLGYADFLLGAVASWSAGYTPITGGRQKDPQVFVQDDFKVLPNFTVNLGLRYERQAGWSEVANRLGTFDPTLQNPVSGTLGAMWISPASGRSALMEGVNVWLPRVSFAWSPKSQWSVRGGFGIYSLPWSIDTYSGGAMGFGTASSGSISNTDQTTPLFYAQNQAPPVFIQNGCVPGTGCYVLASHDPGGYNGQGVNFTPRQVPVGKNYEWTFSVQRELRNMVFEAAYVGNHGSNLPYPVNINQVPQDKLGLLPVQNYRPYPQYNAINGNYFDAYSNYHALQVSFRKRFAHGLTFDTNYVWSKMMSTYDSSGWGSRNGTNTIQNSFARNSTYSLSNFDIPQAWKGSVVYALPFGKGHNLLNQGRLLDAIVGGWQVSSLFQYQSGNTFSVQMNSNSSNSQANSQYPNVVPGVSLYPAQKTAAQWYNPAAFVSPGQYKFGNAGRNILRGPNFSDVDFSASKTMRLPKLERGELQFRFDATDALNHTSLGIPNINIGASTVAQITGAALSGRTLQLGARMSF